MTTAHAETHRRRDPPPPVQMATQPHPHPQPQQQHQHQPIHLPSPTPLQIQSILLTLSLAFSTASDPLEQYFHTLSSSSPSTSSDLTPDVVRESITPNVMRAIEHEHCEVWVIPTSSSSSSSTPPPRNPSSAPAPAEESDTYAAVLLLFPPAHPRPPRPLTPATFAAVVAYAGQASDIKERVLHTPSGYYYMYMLARHPSCTRDNGYSGVVGRLVRDVVLRRAGAGGRVCYLEATSRRARDVYKAFGFEGVGEILLGEVRVWCMLWTPPV